MKKFLLLFSLLLMALTSAFTVSAYASNTYTYTDSISSGSATTLLTETNTSTKTWTLYPSVTLNDNGSLAVSGTGISVAYSNCTSFAGYFYQDSNGNVYQFGGCVYNTPSGDGIEKIPGGAIKYDYAIFSCNSRYAYGAMYIRGSSGTIDGWYGSGTSTTPTYFSYCGEYYFRTSTWINGGAVTYEGYHLIYMGDDTYAWNFRAITTHTVTFDPQSGNVSQATSAVIYNWTYGTLPTPMRTGYTFNGWYTGRSGSGTQVVSSSTVSITSNTTLYAKWTANTYTVTFDPQSGIVSPTTTMATYDSTYGTLPTPTRLGYNFNGWFTDVAGSNSQILNTSTVTITSDIKLYARWTAARGFIVEFESNGGSSINLQTISPGDKLNKPTAPTKAGYTFGGWYSDNGWATAWNFTTGAVMSDMTLYAKWTAAYPYTANISVGSTATTLLTETYTSTKTWTLYPTVTSSDSGSLTVSGTGVSVTYSNYSSYAGYFYQDSSGNIYQLASCTLTHPTSGTIVSGGSVSVSTTDDNCIVIAWGGSITAYDSVVVLNGAVTVGGSGTTYASNKIYTDYQGWYSPCVDDLTGKYYIVGNNVYFYSHLISQLGSDGVAIYGRLVSSAGNDTYAWNFRAVQTHTLTFDPQAGIASPAPSTVIYNCTYDTLPTPTRTGYTLNGWFTGVGGSGTQIFNTSTVTITSDTTLYAKWTANAYTVSFDPQSGTVTPLTVAVAYNSTYGALPTPTRTGYTFNGWFTGTNGSGTKILSTSTVSITSNTTLYAAWQINQCTVAFNSNGGSVVTSQTVNCGGTITTPTVPTKTGYSFGGWYSDSGLTTEWNFTTGTVTSDMALYAKWTATNSYNVSFEPNGGSSVDSQTINSGGRLTEPATPTKTGYTFNGWYTDSGFSTAWNFSTGTVSGDMTLFAKWRPNNSCTVRFDSNGGLPVNSQTISSGGTVTEPAAPTKTGYTFAGWYSNSGLTTAWNFTTGTVAADMILYAKWTVKSTTSSYTLTTTVDKIYNITISASNITDFNGQIFTLTYDAKAMQLTDLCAFTYAKELAKGTISGTDVTITSFSPGTVIFMVNKTVASGKEWSGVLEIFEFKALTSSNTTISIQ